MYIYLAHMQYIMFQFLVGLNYAYINSTQVPLKVYGSGKREPYPTDV